MTEPPSEPVVRKQPLRSARPENAVVVAYVVDKKGRLFGRITRKTKNNDNTYSAPFPVLGCVNELVEDTLPSEGIQESTEEVNQEYGNVTEACQDHGDSAKLKEAISVEESELTKMIQELKTKESEMEQLVRENENVPPELEKTLRKSTVVYNEAKSKYEAYLGDLKRQEEEVEMRGRSKIKELNDSVKRAEERVKLREEEAQKDAAKVETAKQLVQEARAVLNELTTQLDEAKNGHTSTLKSITTGKEVLKEARTTASKQSQLLGRNITKAIQDIRDGSKEVTDNLASLLNDSKIIVDQAQSALDLYKKSMQAQITEGAKILEDSKQEVKMKAQELALKKETLENKKDQAVQMKRKGSTGEVVENKRRRTE